VNIAILVAPLFEESELIYPLYRLKEAGHEVALVGAAQATYKGKNGLEVAADFAVGDVNPADFDGVVIPGGYSPDHMRRDPKLVGLVAELGQTGKPVAAICHGPWMLASTGLAEGKQVTSYSSIKDDLINAGASWTDEEVVVDGNVITSRTPDDLPAFMKAFLGVLES
jgi:protease I